MDWDSDFTSPARSRRERSPNLPADVLSARPNEVPDADFGLFREVLNRHFYPADVMALDPRAQMVTPRLSALHLSQMTIGYVRFGTEASVDPGDLATYHINVPLRGEILSQCGDQRTIASPAVAAVFSPGRRTFLPRWDADAVQLCIKFDRHAVERELADLLQVRVPRPVDFALPFPVGGGAGQRWLSILSTLLQFANAATGPVDMRVIESLERSLISGLLVSQEHSFSDALRSDSGHRIPPGALDRVIEAMETAPDRPYSLSDLSRLSGLSARSLQYVFQDQYGVSPMRYLRRIRLERAREDLRQGHGSVAEIASYWGFSNPGRFARAYQERYGEPPSATRGSSRPPAGARPPDRFANRPADDAKRIERRDGSS